MDGQTFRLNETFDGDDTFSFDFLDNTGNPLAGESVHAGGCVCPACLAHDGGKLFQPGTGTSGAEDTIPGSTLTTATLSPGSYQTSAIDTPGDSDWFRITLTAGQTYTFSTYLPGGGLVDSILNLRNSSGGIVATNDDANTDAGLYYSEITFTATTSGTYYLDVTGYDTATGDYYVTSSRPVADAAGSTAATASSIVVDGAIVSASLEQTGDHDWYAVTLQAGQTYEFVTSATGGASDVDTTLTLRTASGSVLAFNDDSSGTYSRIRFVAQTSGTYYIDVAGWAEGEQGTYHLSAGIAEPLSEYSNDQIADQLLYGYWGGQGAGRHFNVGIGGTITVNVTALTTDGQFLARSALTLWSDVLGINFSEVSSGGQIVFDDTESGAFATSTTSGGFIISSQVNISTDWLVSSGTTLDSYSFQTYLHEIGHALGLGHAGNYNNTADYTSDASYLNDSWATTVMSYFDQSENTFFQAQGFTRVFAVTPRAADIVAIQEAYGVANSTRTGDTVYGVGNTSGRDVYGVGDAATDQLGRLLAFTIVDHGGVDTLNYSSFATAQVINLNQETYSNVGGSVGNMTIARGTVIENAVGGSGSDQLIGNGVANRLTGLGGNDSIDGGSNVDTAVVRGLQSAYTVTQTSTGVFQVTGPDGTDTLRNVEYL
ncbi:M10 family metallopeptidase C-terminal domain-containing protein, partial [Qipengyuania sp. RANM35]|uniref:M10 family metallopeptidase C-terminal domain-containing protein n=1 Tax=Qipengyuania sp. RANM35 TaxID=3068635 RepID=UPI0034DB161D